MTEKRPFDCKEAARGLRRDLKTALTDFAAGKGGLFQLLNQIERVVKYVCNNPNAMLRGASDCMREFIRKHACDKIENTGLPGIDWDSLYCYVTKHRNDIAHTGTEAALAGAHTAALTTVLLDALLHAGRKKGQAKKGQAMKISEVMVANPTCAEKWQTLADLRRTMLVNDFSVLPLRDGKCSDTGQWQVVRAEELAAYLPVEDEKRRKERNKKTLGCAIGKGDEKLELHCVETADESKEVEKLKENKKRVPSAIIVTTECQNKHHIVGIVTAFDLL